MLQQEAESKFIFNKETENISYIKDHEGQTLGFNKMDNGNSVIFTKDLEGIEVAIEDCVDGTKIFHMERDSKGLPAMHEMRPDGTEHIYLFDAGKRLEKLITMKSNGDKITVWFSPNGDEISQEQRQKGGIIFTMKTINASSLIRLHIDGHIETHGDQKLNQHLQKVFNKFLDGIEI